MLDMLDCGFWDLGLLREGEAGTTCDKLFHHHCMGLLFLRQLLVAALADDLPPLVRQDIAILPHPFLDGAFRRHRAHTLGLSN